MASLFTMMTLLLLLSGTVPALCNQSSRFTLDHLHIDVTTYIHTEMWVFHMDMDQYIDGNVLFSDTNALKTGGSRATQTIAGQAKEKGYREGVGVAARFGQLSGFYQINNRKVIVADFYNHCLRQVDRRTGQTMLFAGTCTKAGYADGTSALFQHPMSIIPDNQNKGKMLVTDRSNKVVRHVDITTKVVSTFFKYKELPFGLYDITQDVSRGDLYMTTDNAVYQLGYHNKEMRLLAGDPSRRGYNDGDFADALFHFPQKLLLIDNERKLLVAGKYNHRLRVLDRDTNTTYSICTGTSGHSNGDTNSCSLHNPQSLMVSQDSLYIGEWQNIRKLSGQVRTPMAPTASSSTTPPTIKSTVPTTSSTTPPTIKSTAPTTSSSTVPTTEPSTKPATSSSTIPTTTPSMPRTTPMTSMAMKTTTSPCTHGNITKQLPPGERTVDVEIVAGHSLQLPAGEYLHKITSQPNNCSLHISVIEDPTYTHNTCLTDKQSILSSPLSGKGSLDITCCDVIHRLRLPVGDYNYEQMHPDHNCSSSVNIADYQLIRRLNIKAEYDIPCNLLSDPVSKSTAISLANSHFEQIDGASICGKDCNRQKGAEANLSCANDTLTILWPTDQTYRGNVIEVPPVTRIRLIRRLSPRAIGSWMKIVILQRLPPVVKPSRTDVVLTSSCLNNKIYTADTDSCI